MDDILKLIQSVGFPIFVAVWFLVRTEKRLEKIGTQLAQMVGILSSHGDKSGVFKADKDDE